MSWDRVALIRPTGVEASVAAAGPVERSILAYEINDFVDPVIPDGESLERIYDAFSDADRESLDRLQHRYGPEALDRLVAPARSTRQAAPAVADPRLIWVYAAEHDSKMNYMMAELLLRRGLAVESRDREHQRWLGMHPRLASVYMTALTGELARTRGYVACTDDIAAHRAAGALGLDQIDQTLTGRRALTCGNKPIAARPRSGLRHEFEVLHDRRLREERTHRSTPLREGVGIAETVHVVGERAPADQQ